MRTTQRLRQMVWTSLLQLLVPALGAGAQSDFRIGLGLDQRAQLNSGESAYRYHGVGWTAGAAVDRVRPRSDFAISLSFASATLHSSISAGDVPRASVEAIEADAGYGRVVGDATSRIRWSVGAAVHDRAESSTHTYATGSNADFQFETLTIGPFVRTTIGVRRGTITNDVSMPVAGVIDFPYSDDNSNSFTHPSFAGAPSLFGVDDVLAYRVGPLDRPAFVFVYRVSYFRYALGTSRRDAHQSLSAYASFPFHPARR